MTDYESRFYDCLSENESLQHDVDQLTKENERLLNIIQKPEPDSEPICTKCKAIDAAYKIGTDELESLRAQVETLLTEKKQDAENMLRLIMDMRYVAGIVQRGRGKPLEHGEKFAQAVLDYVKSLEEQNALLTLQLKEALKRMDRARGILTFDNPTPNCNWGMLDTADIRAAIAQEPMHTEREE